MFRSEELAADQTQPANPKEKAANSTEKAADPMDKVADPKANTYAITQPSMQIGRAHV